MPRRNFFDFNAKYLDENLIDVENQLCEWDSMIPYRTFRSSSSDDSTPEQSLAGLIDGKVTIPETVVKYERATIMDLIISAPKPCASAELSGSPILKSLKSSSLDAGMEALDISDKKSNRWDKNFDTDFGVCLETICTSGLHDDARMKLVQKYLVPPNFQLIKAPILNKEVKETLTLTAINRDMIIETKQNVTAAALSCLGEAIRSLMSENIKNADSVDLLIDAARLISDCQHKDSLIRRDFVVIATKTEMLESLANTKINNYLFGSNLGDIINPVKAINKPAAKSWIPYINVSFNRKRKNRPSKESISLEGHESSVSSAGSVSKKAKTRPMSQTKGQQAKVRKLLKK